MATTERASPSLLTRAVNRVASFIPRVAFVRAGAPGHEKGPSTGDWISQKFGWASDDDDGASAKLTSATYVSEGYAKHAWTYAAIRAIVSAGSRCPWGIRRTRDKKPLQGHPAEALLLYANAVQNDQRLFATTLLANELWGQSFWDVDLQRGKAVALWPIPPLRMKLKATKGGVPQIYEYTDDNRNAVPFSADEVVWFHFEGPGHWLAVQSPMDAARQAVQTDLYAIRGQESFFERGHHAFALSTDQQLSTPAVKSLREQWSQNYKGLLHFFRPVVLDRGLHPVDIGKPPSREWIDLREQLRQDVLAVFHVPPAIVGLYQSAQFGVSIREQRKMFWTDCLQPRLDGIASDLTDQLVIRIDDAAEFYWRYDLIPELQPDWSVMLGPLVSAVGGPFLMVDEAREIVGREPWPKKAGQVVYTSFSVIAETPGAGGSPAPAEAAAAATVAPVDEKPTETAPVAEPTGATGQSEEASGPQKRGAWLIYKQGGKTIRRLGKSERAERWRSLNAERQKQQKLLAEKLRPVWDELAKGVVSRLRGTKGGFGPARAKAPRVDRIVFSVDEGQAAYADVIDPFLANLAAATGQQATNLVTTGVTFSLDTARMEAALKARDLHMRSVAETAQGRCREALAEGLANGETIDQLEARVLEWAAQGKEGYAENVARTETGTVMNAAAREGWEQGGADGREWLAIVDDRTRGANDKDTTDHLSHDGEVLFGDEQFVLAGPDGDEACDYPMDPNLSAANICNCRCTSSPVFKSESGGEE